MNRDRVIRDMVVIGWRWLIMGGLVPITGVTGVRILIVVACLISDGVVADLSGDGGGDDDDDNVGVEERLIMVGLVPVTG